MFSDRSNDDMITEAAILTSMDRLAERVAAAASGMPSLTSLIGPAVAPPAPVAPPPTFITITTAVHADGYAGIGQGQTFSFRWPLPDPVTGDVDPEVEDALLDEFDPLPLSGDQARKETAPVMFPCTFRQDGKGDKRTKSGDRSAHAADTCGLLIFDVDRGNLQGEHIEEALKVLGSSALYWQTWQANAFNGLRWRIVVPLARPVPARKAYTAIWKTIGRSLTMALGNAAGIENPWEITDANGGNGLLDWSCSSAVKAAILPCYPTEGTGSSHYPWGGVRPRVTFVPGPVLDLTDGELRKLGIGDRTSRSRPREGANLGGRPKGSGTTFGGQPLVPYIPKPDASHVSETIDLLPAESGRTAAPLLALDAIARLRRDGVNVGQGARQSTLSGLMWQMYRLGFDYVEIENAAVEAVDRTDDKKDRKYLEGEALKLYRRFGGQCEEHEAWVSAVVKACRDRVASSHRPALRQYARVLARADHLRTGKGGQLDHEALAAVVGLHVTALTRIRGLIREAGYVSEEGESLGRRYWVHDQPLSVPQVVTLPESEPKKRGPGRPRKDTKTPRKEKSQAPVVAPDDDPIAIRSAIFASEDQAVLIEAASSTDPTHRLAAAGNPSASGAVLATLAGDSDPRVRLAVAKHRNADLDTLMLLQDDEALSVSVKAMERLGALEVEAA